MNYLKSLYLFNKYTQELQIMREEFEVSDNLDIAVKKREKYLKKLEELIEIDNSFKKQKLNNSLELTIETFEGELKQIYKQKIVSILLIDNYNGSLGCMNGILKLIEGIKSKYFFGVLRTFIMDITRCIDNFSVIYNNFNSQNSKKRLNNKDEYYFSVLFNDERSESVENILLDIDNNMDGLEFEKISKKILENNNFNNIQITKASGDFGVDILAMKDNVKYAIQCKRYSSPIGVKAIQEVIASKSMNKCHVAVVLTNNYFTNSAKELAEKNNVLLWDRNVLIEMINERG